MKKGKNILLNITLLAACIICICGILIYKATENLNKPENILKRLLNVNNYSTKVTYVVKNSRGEFEEEGLIEFNKNEGTKITLLDRIEIFKDGKLYMEYIDHNKNYSMSEDFDNFYKYMFINYLHKFLNDENNVTYSSEVIDGTECYIVEYLLLSGNENFYREKLYIDIKNRKPLKAIVYDKSDGERLKISYSEFAIK